MASRIRADASAYTVSAREGEYADADGHRKVGDYRKGVEDLEKGGQGEPQAEEDADRRTQKSKRDRTASDADEDRTAEDEGRGGRRMRPAGCEAELLRALASMPFLDRLEMVAVTGWSRGPVYEAAAKLESEGFCASALHATDILPPSRRFHLTAAGLRRLADEEGVSPDELVRSRPVSAQWRRNLMERMDALAAVYHVASIVSNVEYPIDFRWYRAMPMDAAMTLPDGRTIGVVRQGLTADRSGFAKRVWRMRDEPMPGVVLMLMADDVRLRHARRLLATTQVPALFALEREAVLSKAADRIWSPSAVRASLDLRYVLDRLSPGGDLPVEREPQRADFPADIAVEGAGVGHLRPHAALHAQVRREARPRPHLRLALDRPRRPGRASRRLAPEGLPAGQPPGGLRPRGAPPGRGRTPRRRRPGAGPFSPAGTARRSAWRRSGGASPLQDADAPLEWRNVSGSRSRQLLRNMEHTAAVHSFLGALTAQAPLLGWEIVQLDPPRRASRHFRHDDRMRAVNPDAFGVLRKGEAAWAFFLEWERRAVRPSTMSDRLAPYLRYYSSHRPTDDHGTRPSVLIVFDNEIAQTHFLRVAREEMRAEGTTVPLWVSHREAIEAPGAAGTRMARPGRLGVAPGPAAPMNMNTTAGA